MNKKYIALAAAGVVVLGMGAFAVYSAFGGTDIPENTPPLAPTPEITQTIPPTETPLPSETVPPTDSPTTPPDETPEATPKPTPDSTPKPTPESTPKPTPKPTPTPAPESTPTPTPQVKVVQSVWDEIAKGDLPAFSDVDAATLTELYGISSGDVEEFICKIPMMSANINEYFIAKVADGKMDAVKAACLKRQEALAGGFLYPSMVELVDDYRLVTSGNYILFVISDQADAAVTAFNTFAK